ncbi:HAMP domain-containing sensor histidine kinase [Paenibacillus typhae]|uniref:Signal transduction histidine-protein kinase ArlS n=2 Tax=Paenibacillus typhae TaxID=1174501 RepID=A0A1G8FL02_9BACL|nr:ATP-binding protein [Paenibacillus typhae]SDH82739.1 HAMP domain-containing protein [Paenibacillus typhae]
MIKVKRLYLRNMNIKWKLTLWAAVLMLLLFLSYNLLQFTVIQNWVNNHEKEIIRNNMDEVVAYLQDFEPGSDLTDSGDYLKILNERYQLIRIVDGNDSPILTISDKVPEHWVQPKYVASEELLEISPGGDTLLIYRQPLEISGFSGSVEIVRNLENFESLINLITTLFIITGFVAIILSLIGGRLISFQLLNPINSMIRTMRRIRENGLKERVQISDQQDEMTELSLMFNELMDSLEQSFRQQQQFIEDASHELKTPLSIIHGHLSMIKRWGKDDPEVLNRSIQLSLNETNRLIQMVSELLILTRANHSAAIAEYAPENIRVKQVIGEIIENFKFVNPEFRMLTRLEISDDCVLPVQKNHFQQMMIIILDNAMKYTRDQKEIRVSAAMETGLLAISVMDYGMGIPEDELYLVTNRFYRVDKARSRKHGGNGLGLAIAKRLMEGYAGELQIDSVYGEWTKVTLRFPYKNEPAAGSGKEV